MKVESLTHFIVGPPASGKSTIGLAAATQLHLTFRTIDDWTPRGKSMTDAQIQQALNQLVRSASPLNEVIEFCHHDYDELLETNRYPIFTAARKIVVTAPLALCKARNRLRRSPVREAYVERAWQSVQSLVKRCLMVQTGRILLIDTSSQSVDAAVTAVTNFVRQGNGGCNETAAEEPSLRSSNAGHSFGT